MRPDDRAQLRTLALALLISLLLWNLPVGAGILYPFKLLATWFHEMSHGLAMIATGAQLDHIVLYRDTSGLSYAVSAVEPLGTAFIAAAGYMGTPLWGALLLVTTPTPRASRIALLVLGVAMLTTAIFAITPDPDGSQFGPYAIAAIGTAIAACGVAVPGRFRVFCAHFIAAQACVNALLDIRVLFRPMQVVNGSVAGTSDSTAMAESTFGTRAPWAVTSWALFWLAWSVIVLFFAMRVGGSRMSRRTNDGERSAAGPELPNRNAPGPRPIDADRVP